MDIGEILDQFDVSARNYTFPDLGHGYYYAVDARLHAYADRDRWALIVEAVGYGNRCLNLVDMLHVYGNCLTKGTFGFGSSLDRVDNMSELTTEDECEAYVGDVPIMVRGNALRVDGKAGEDIWRTFRRLVPQHRDLLLADEAELREHIPADLPEILRLEQWCQPWYTSEDELPSWSPFYRLMAAVLAHADADLYRPVGMANTHWSQWPESGNL